MTCVGAPPTLPLAGKISGAQHRFWKAPQMSVEKLARRIGGCGNFCLGKQRMELPKSQVQAILHPLPNPHPHSSADGSRSDCVACDHWRWPIEGEDDLVAKKTTEGGKTLRKAEVPFSRTGWMRW